MAFLSNFEASSRAQKQENIFQDATFIVSALEESIQDVWNDHVGIYFLNKRSLWIILSGTKRENDLLNWMYLSVVKKFD